MYIHLKKNMPQNIHILSVLEIGEVTNQVVYMVCKILKNLSSFSFVGNDFSYSGKGLDVWLKTATKIAREIGLV